MKQLSGIDASFLYNETAVTPQHVGSIQYMDVSDAKRAAFFGEFRKLILSRIHLLPYLTNRLQTMPFGVDHPVWVRDTTFDIDDHLHHVVLDHASRDDLEAVCGELYATMLDRRKPLWQMYVIDGIASGEIAVLTKTHHACLDGLASVAAVETLGDFSPSPTDVDPAPRDFWDTPAPTASDLIRHAWLHLAKQQLDVPFRIARQADAAIRERLLAEPEIKAAPKAPWNASIDGQRKLAGTHFSLRVIKTIGRRVGAKVNDVVLAIASEALNRYLAPRMGTPPTPLLAGCPVSTRKAGDREMNNQVTMMTLSLESDIQDIVERMRAIRACSLAAKERLNTASDPADGDFAAPFLPAQWQAWTASQQSSWMADWSTRVPFNLVISNVPGPKRPVFSAGAEMIGSTPLSIVTHGAGLNVTVASYVDRLDVGLTAATKRVPDVGDLRDHFETVYRELAERVLGVSPDAWEIPPQSTPVAA